MTDIEVKRPLLRLIRGLPGSGKSTLARAMADFTHYEADMWMVDEAGNYTFDPNQLRRCHMKCLNATMFALAKGKNVVVSNTFTTIWEMQPYLDLGYPVEIIEATGNFKNIHDVPDSVIKRMRDRWELIKP